MLQALTFDVTRTLLHCPRLGSIYAEVLARHGIEVDAERARQLVGVVWSELACAAERGKDRFTSHPDGARGWWRRFLQRFCEHLDAPQPSPFAAAELFSRFAGPEAWEVYAEVPDVLDELRGQGFRLGIVSNWDERLPQLLEGLGLARRFDAVVYSSAAGTEKPDPRIFEKALAALRVSGSAALHIGDSKLEDVEGATAAGMLAVLLVRGAAPPLPPSASGAGERVLHDLSPLPAIIRGSREPRRPGGVLV